MYVFMETRRMKHKNQYRVKRSYRPEKLGFDIWGTFIAAGI
jgi:hypothetical protein